MIIVLEDCLPYMAYLLCSPFLVSAPRRNLTQMSIFRGGTITTRQLLRKDRELLLEEVEALPLFISAT